MRYCLTILFFISTGALCEVAPDGAQMQTSFTKCENLDCGLYTSLKFRMEDNFLTGRYVEGESFFASSDGAKQFNTAFKPDKILTVYNHNTGKIYLSGKDYIPTETGISIPEGSSITLAPPGFENSVSSEDLKNYGVKLSTEFQTYQYAVSYYKSETFKQKTYGSLSAFKNKLGKYPTSITFFGDSITDGANATNSSAPPYQPGYAGLVMARLNELYPNMVQYRNNSVGGWSAINATASVEYRVNDLKSDLVVLAFGMNDAGGYAPEEYKKHIKYVIDAIRAKQPETAILLVSPTRANPNTFVQKREYVDAYLPVLIGLSESYENIAVADLTTPWDRLLKNKSYYDITGNGLNHPNDFGHRIIAEVVLNSIIN
ncbi:SGNH/GDSL hydrolase family protein [Pseudomonas lurida]|uniref:SGNH/GDSL hydrolase family protein n=1 Tax=Pseudomonas lurida TaxID=244566 RepID=UPI0034D95550